MFDILQDQIAKEGRFSAATLSDAINMLPSNFRNKAEGNRLAPRMAVSDVADRFIIFIRFKVIVHHRRASPRSGRSALHSLRRMIWQSLPNTHGGIRYG